MGKISTPSVSTIITTNVVPSSPALTHIQRTIESLHLVPELKHGPVLVVCDGPTENEVNVHAEYVRALSSFCARFANISLCTLDSWGHLSTVIETAFELIDSTYVFIQQHDLPLIRSFDLAAVIRSLERDSAVKHVRLNKRANLPIGWDRTPVFGEYKSCGLSLTRTGCWSDQSHLATRTYYTEMVLPAIAGCRTFPENILNPQMRGDDDQVWSAHNLWGTFLYGPPGHPAIIEHTDARVRIENDTKGHAALKEQSSEQLS